MGRIVHVDAKEDYFFHRVREGFIIATDVSELIPCGTFGQSIGMDYIYEGLNPLRELGFKNPWHIGAKDSYRYPNPEEIIQGEFELLAFLYSMMLSVKPRIVAETGTNVGLTTRALAAGCWANGFGRVFSAEIKEEYYNHAKNFLMRHAHRDFQIELWLGPATSMPRLPDADFVFIDSSYESREIELTLLKPGAIFVYHDTWAERHLLNGELSKKERYQRVDIPGPRGYSIGKVISR